MNRTIKFRIWDKNKKSFVYFDIYNSNLLSTPEHKDAIIQQYTGLSDDNGDDIYEGDYLEMGSYTFGLVKYDFGGFYFHPMETDTNLFMIIDNVIPLIDFLKSFSEEKEIKKHIKGNIFTIEVKPAKKIHPDDLHIINPSPYNYNTQDESPLSHDNLNL